MTNSATIDPAGLRLLLARHGATAWSDEGRYQGSTDLPLSVSGIAQAAQLGVWLADERVEAVIHSGARRAAETVQQALPAPPAFTSIDVDWREIDHGAWEGMTYRQLLDECPEQARAHWDDPWAIPAPGGETLASVDERVRRACASLIERWAGHTVLLVAHATPLQLLLCQLLGAPASHYWRWKLDLGSLSCLELYSSGPIVSWLNRGYTRPPAC
ncbi:MAG TPA: histidine phosphatase family protein [Herpetosiphonaceae bacterium]|nr:histidine phosphatase family protein [Herpetosiphonaceae bacterium]